jgi:uncharacterized SAM-binding protein YcdF (DUF218 family)
LASCSQRRLGPIVIQMKFHLFERRTRWWPTLWGWLLIAALAFAPPLLWWFKGESFLSSDQRLSSADILVVEGWISVEGIRAGVKEFKSGQYNYVVATGGLSGESWSTRRWNYAVEAEEQLIRAGIPRHKVLIAPAKESGSQRTHEMAISTWHTLRTQNIAPVGIHIFTRGTHARRSRLTFQRVIGNAVEVGVVSWVPPGRDHQRWWQTSERAEETIKETVGYLYELLLHSGRKSRKDLHALRPRHDPQREAVRVTQPRLIDSLSSPRK